MLTQYQQVRKSNLEIIRRRFGAALFCFDHKKRLKKSAVVKDCTNPAKSKKKLGRIEVNCGDTQTYCPNPKRAGKWRKR